MKPTYDIFKQHPGSGPIWVACVQGLDQAKKRLASLLKTDPADYFVYDLAGARLAFRSSSPAQCG